MKKNLKQIEKYFSKEETVKIPENRSPSLDFPCWYDSENGKTFKVSLYSPPNGYRFYVVTEGSNKGKIIYLEDVEQNPEI